jgi:hypothetical protein
MADGPQKNAVQANPDCGHCVPLEQTDSLNSILCDVIAAEQNGAYLPRN